MIKYRLGDHQDQALIATMHAQSWRDSYRNILSDDYLENTVLADRAEVWRKRFEARDPDLHLIIAETAVGPCGFAGIYLHYDPNWGALIDNLHVLGSNQRLGIGMELMRRSAELITASDPKSNMYLWVYTANLKARRFYQKIGGRAEEKTMVKNPDGTTSEIIRIVWETPLLPLGTGNKNDTKSPL